MTDVGSDYNKLTAQLRDMARTIGPLIAIAWLLAGIGYSILDPWTVKTALAITFLSFLVLSVGIAWWKESLGSIMLIVLSVAFSIFACVVADHNKALALFLSGGPFLVVGILFVVIWQRSKRTCLSPSPSSSAPNDIDVEDNI